MTSKANITLAAVLALFLASLATISPVAAAQQTQSGLVNVQVGDIKTGNILSNNTVQVQAAVDVVATVCNVTVTAAVLSDQLAKSGSYSCQGATQFVRITQSK
jgi:hypothetical protein